MDPLEYSDHVCAKCLKPCTIHTSGRQLKDYEWCPECKAEHKRIERTVWWFNYKFKMFTRRDIFNRDGYKCYLCSTELTQASPDATLDHLVPISRGGFSSFDNLKLCCAGCNIQKADMLLEEYEQHRLEMNL